MSRSGMTAGSWYTDTTPPCRASAGERATYGSPRTRIVPSSGWTAPVRILTSVLLPAPLAPIRACTSPARTDSDADRRAATAPYRFATPVASSSRSDIRSLRLDRGLDPRVPAEPAPSKGSVAGCLLAQALAGDEVVHGVRGPVLDREPEGPQLREVRVLRGLQRSLARVRRVVPQLRGDVGRGLGHLTVEELQREGDAGAGDGRRVGDRRADKALLIQELRHE